MKLHRSPLEKADILGQVAASVKGGLSQNAACAGVGISPACYLRWRAGYSEKGIKGLEADYSKVGRPPLARLSEDEELNAKALYALTGSKTLALRRFANTAGCSQGVADAILSRRSSKHKITSYLRRQISLPEAVVNFHKGPRAVRKFFINPRTLTYIDPTGEERVIRPGDLSERDDMSNNFLCTVDWPWGGDPCSDKYGVRVARGQNLMQIDVASLYFQSFNFLIRLRDSYRADDIWQWVGQTYRDIFLPAIGERWERGIWQSHKLQGVPIDPGHTADDQRVGGIKALGRTIIVSQSPTTKIIENRFKFLQAVMREIPGQIGAKRGEMERETKLWMECQQGRRDPRNHFLPYATVCDKIESALHYVNSEPVEGTIYHGIPTEIYQKGISERDDLVKLTPEQTYLFSRKLSKITVTKGHACVRRNDPDGRRRAWWFHHPELYRHEGRKVAAFLDDLDASAGATLVLLQGEELGRVLGHADLVDGTPQFAMGLQEGGGRASDAALDAMDRRKAFQDAVRTEYRALGIGGRRLARSSQIRDGAGGTARVDELPGQAVRETAAPVLPPRRETAAVAAPVDADRLRELEEQFRRNNPGVVIET